jgi:hypothetical protein
LHCSRCRLTTIKSCYLFFASPKTKVPSHISFFFFSDKHITSRELGTALSQVQELKTALGQAKTEKTGLVQSVEDLHATLQEQTDDLRRQLKEAKSGTIT